MLLGGPRITRRWAPPSSTSPFPPIGPSCIVVFYQRLRYAYHSRLWSRQATARLSRLLPTLDQEGLVQREELLRRSARIIAADLGINAYSNIIATSAQSKSMKPLSGKGNPATALCLLQSPQSPFRLVSLVDGGRLLQATFLT